MNRFPKGPYIIDEYGELTAPIVGKEGEQYCIAEINPNRTMITEDEWDGLKNLLVAAPEMHLVIQAMLKCAKENNMVKGAYVLELMEEVIAKAEGGR